MHNSKNQLPTRIRLLVCIAIHLCAVAFAGAQQNPGSLLAIGNKISQRYISAVAEKSEKITGQIDKQTEKYLAKLEKQENSLRKRLGRIDTLAANRIFADARQQYRQMQDKVKNKSSQLSSRAGKYLPWLDSASTSLKFLEKNQL